MSGNRGEGRRAVLHSKSQGLIACVIFLWSALGVASADTAPIPEIDPIADGFKVTALFPLTQGLAPYPNRPGTVLPRGSYSVSSSFVWTNTLRTDASGEFPGYALIVDGESLVQNLGVRAGLGRGLELEAWLQGTLLYPGFFDDEIAAFHKLFGFANQSRDSVPPNQLSIKVSTPYGTLVDTTATRSAITSSGLGLAWSLPFQLPLVSSLRFKIPIPGGPPWLLSGSPALEASLGYSAAYGRLSWNWDAGLAWQGGDAALGDFPRRDILIQGGGRLFYLPTPDLGIGIEAAGSASPFATEERYLGGMAGNLWMGLRARITRSWTLEVALIEELASWASIEVGIQAGFSWHGVLASKPE